MRRALWALLLAGCGDPCPTGSMLDSPGGLIVLQEEHPDAWGEPTCETCHAQAALHRRACTDEVDLEGVRGVVAAEGVESCASCHGPMGSDE